MPMITSEPAALAPLALAEARAFLNISRDDDDAVLIGHLRSAAELCEQFIGQSLLLRQHREAIAVSREWQKLGAAPVTAITGVQGITSAGESFALPSDAYAIELSPDGIGRVRVLHPGSASRVEIRYLAGIAAHWAELPEALRQGIVRLAAHVHLGRDGGDAAPPAMIGALWRPWRRVRL